MNYTIRRAKPNDSAKIAQLMYYAMADIVFDFLGQKNEDNAIKFLEELVEQDNNQYSFENTFVLEIEDNIAASFTLYEGGNLEKLREKVLTHLKTNYNRTINPQDETEAGEIYIDTIAVFPEYRGKGLGNIILDYIIEEFANKQAKNVGLLVDHTNPKAKNLYESKGFEVVGEKSLMSKNHEHMQYKKGV